MFAYLVAGVTGVAYGILLVQSTSSDRLCAWWALPPHPPDSISIPRQALKGLTVLGFAVALLFRPLDGALCLFIPTAGATALLVDSYRRNARTTRGVHAK